MQDPTFMTPLDEASRICPVTTLTATGAAGPLDQGAGFAPGGDGMPVALALNVSAVKTSAGTETYAVKMQGSDDGATWTDSTPTVAVTAAAAKQVGTFVKRRYHQVVWTLGGAAPSVTFEAFLQRNVT